MRNNNIYCDEAEYQTVTGEPNRTISHEPASLAIQTTQAAIIQLTL